MQFCTAKQILAASLLDEIQIHIVSGLLDDSVRLFDQPSGTSAKLESSNVIHTLLVMNLWLCVTN